MIREANPQPNDRAKVTTKTTGTVRVEIVWTVTPAQGPRQTLKDDIQPNPIGGDQVLEKPDGQTDDQPSIFPRNQTNYTCQNQAKIGEHSVYGE